MKYVSLWLWNICRHSAINYSLHSYVPTPKLKHSKIIQHELHSNYSLQNLTIFLVTSNLPYFCEGFFVPSPSFVKNLPRFLKHASPPPGGPPLPPTRGIQGLTVQAFRKVQSDLERREVARCLEWWWCHRFHAWFVGWLGGNKTWYMLGGGMNNGCGAEVDMVWVVFFLKFGMRWDMIRNDEIYKIWMMWSFLYGII